MKELRRFLLAAAALAATCFAQSISGDLVVAVQDPTNSAIAGANLALTETATNLKFDGQTNEQGICLFSQLKPGAYRLEVSSAGFQKTVVDDIRILYLLCRRVRLSQWEVPDLAFPFTGIAAFR